VPTDLSDGVHGGFNPARDIRYTSRTSIQGRTFFIAHGAIPNSFYVSEQGPGDRFPFWVTFPTPRQFDGRRSILGCDCQSLGGDRIRSLDQRGIAEIIIPQGQAEICIHILAVMEVMGRIPDSLRGLVSEAIIQAEYRRRSLDQVNIRPA